MNTKKLGFTLIELLIVIALLGILAVGLLAAIDPLEQFKKGQDTATRNAVQELYNGFIRYYAIHTEYPWGEDTTIGPMAISSAEAQGYISSVIDAGELKTNFLENIQDPDNVIVWGASSTNLIEHSVCFHPASKSIKTDPNTKYSRSGTTLESCSNGEDDPSTETCYWCLR